jgi:hypothetical protein
MHQPLLVMNRLALVTALSLVLMGASCPPAGLDPETRAAAYAERMVSHLVELQSATIAANEQGLVTDRDAVNIVKFTTSSIRTVQASPYGWFPAVDAGFLEVQKLVPAGQGSSLEASYVTIRAVLELIRSGGVDAN